jgi:anion-transporting  ArsA/GET3 family ATPase
VARLLDHRLVFVTGKGGVGKSTVATALGLLAARTGRRTIVAELASQDRVHRSLHSTAPDAGTVFKEIELAPGLFTISIDPQHAMDEYLRVKAGPFGHALGSSRLFWVFAMATPGMRELLTMGKIWELAQLHRRTHGAAPYDLVIVDAPATGHGVGILRTPRMFAEIAMVGPIAATAGVIAETIADREFTGVVAVCTPEEMPVNETLELDQTLRADGLGLDAVIVNAVYPKRFDGDEAAQLVTAAASSSAPLTRGALHAAISEHRRAQTQSAQRHRLAEGLEAPLIELPYLFSEELGRGELEGLADELEPELDLPLDPEVIDR